MILSYGDPYIVVYMEYFGVSILLSVLVDMLSKYIRSKWVAYLICFIFASISAWTVCANYEKITVKNQSFKEPRLAMEKLIHAGFLTDLPIDALVVTDSPYMWESGGSLCTAFLSQHAGKKIKCLSMAELDVEYAQQNHLNSDVFLLRREINAEGVEVAKLIGGGSQLIGELMGGSSRISRALGPESPAVVVLGKGFYGWEPANAKDFSWSSGVGEVMVWNLSAVDKLARLHFTIQTMPSQKISIGSRGDVLMEHEFSQSEALEVNIEVLLTPGRNILTLNSKGNPAKVSGDPRQLSFRILNFTLI